MLFGSTKNSLKKKFSSFFEIFLAKKILRLERSEKRYDFSKLFPSFLLSSRIALKSLSSSSQRFFFFFPRGLSKGRGGGVPRETFKARARYNDEEEREREREPLLLLQKREVFFYPRLKPPFLKQDQKSKEKRNVPMRTTRRWWPQ